MIPFRWPKTRFRPGLSALLILCAASLDAVRVHAQAESTKGVERSDALQLAKGEARLESVFEPFDTVVVGDPAIVATSVVSATALVLTALAEGRTNIILLDADGAVQARWSVSVRDESGHSATIHRGTTRSVVSCVPDCRPTGAIPDAGSP